MSPSLVQSPLRQHDCPPRPASVDTAVAGVTVVVPMFNESECAPLIVASLRDLQELLADQFRFEFVLVDDGSSDDTVARLEAAIGDDGAFKVVSHGANRGIAAAIHTGLRAAEHEIVASIDCDGSYDPRLLAKLIPRLEAGVDLVTASPYHADGAVENVPHWRVALSRFASRLYDGVHRQNLSCYTSAFRVYRRSAVVDLPLTNEGFVGVAELLCRVIEQGGQVAEYPAVLKPRQAGCSKMRVIRTIWRHFRFMSSQLGKKLFGRRRRVARIDSIPLS